MSYIRNDSSTCLKMERGGVGWGIVVFNNYEKAFILCRNCGFGYNDGGKGGWRSFGKFCYDFDSVSYEKRERFNTYVPQ